LRAGEKIKKMADLTKNFDRSEMCCNCGCGTDNISLEFINRLQKARDLAGIPFHINSACRCPSKNKLEGGTYSSDHLSTESNECKAADVACRSSHDRFILIKAGLNAGFNRIGVGRTFIHFGMSDTNPQEVIWLY